MSYNPLWTPFISFELHCAPKAQARARHSFHKNRHITYKAENQIRNETELEALLLPHKPAAPIKGAVALFFMAHMPMPKSWSIKKQAKMIADQAPHIGKPDLDNLAKQLLDAMTRLKFWEDDRQITRLDCEKIYSREPRWEVAIRTRSIAL